MRRFAGPTREYGFTAIEVTAVATIIAILALILIPLVRGRVESARLAAAQDDLNSLMKAQMLANADTNGNYYRLQDLDNTTFFDPALPNQSIDLAVPHCYWNRELSPDEREALAKIWDGPYCAYPKAMLLGQAGGPTGARNEYPEFYRPPTGVPDNGPVILTGRDATAGENDLVPIDPWGTPYLFFGPGVMGADNNPAIPLANQTDFGNAALYSLGPDRLPGDGQPLTSLNLYRETGVVGAPGSDDLKIVF